MSTRLVALCLAAAATSGCYVIPPLRASAGGGGGAGQVVSREAVAEEPSKTSAAAGLGQVRFAMVPTALGTPSRTLDLSLGWTLDWTSAQHHARSFRHGPFFEGVWFAHRERTSPTQSWRFGPTMLFEAHLPRRGDGVDGMSAGAGLGIAGGVLLELTEHVSGPIFLGGAKGDFGAGVALRGGVRHIDDGTYGYALLSLEFRWPGMVGGAIPFTPMRR